MQSMPLSPASPFLPSPVFDPLFARGMRAEVVQVVVMGGAVRAKSFARNTQFPLSSRICKGPPSQLPSQSYL
jgi:hypothetical protein